MAQELPELEIKTAVMWIDTVRNMIKDNHIDWVILDPDNTRNLNSEVKKTAEATLKTTIMGFIPLEMRACLSKTGSNLTVQNILASIEGKPVDSSEERQKELQVVAKKIKMTRNNTVENDISKYRILREEMSISGCSEIDKENEKANIRFIINGLECNDAWNGFRTCWKMIPRNVRPATTDELERLMAEYAHDHREANELRKDS